MNATSSSPRAQYPSLRDSTVFVTGGGAGIGAAIVAGFAAQGAREAFIDIDAAASEALCARVATAGHTRPWWRLCDVRDAAALQARIVEAAHELGDFAVLVNNVASDDRHALESVTPDYYDERIAVNQRAAFFALQTVVPGMKRLGGGSIVNLGSIGWQIKSPDYPAYAIAKSSAHGLTRGTAQTLGRDRIRINTVSPGWVMTERQQALWVTPEGIADLERNQCLPDRLAPDDIAAMVLFLASDDARACTAQEFIVDGGWR